MTAQPHGRVSVYAVHGRERLRRARGRMRLGDVVLLIWGIGVVGPMIWVFLGAFKNNAEIFSSPWTLPAAFRLDAWERAWTTANLGQYFLNTVLVVGVATTLTMVTGAMAAYVLVWYRFPGRRVVYWVFVAGLAFPVFLAISPLFFIVRSFALLDSHLGLILVYSAYALPFTVFFLCAFFTSLPLPTLEAALLDGCSHLRIFLMVAMPLARSALISVAILNAIGLWNQYLLPVVLISSPEKAVVTQGIASIAVSSGYASDWPALFAAVALAILPMIGVYALFHRRIQSGLTTGAIQ